MSRNHREKLHPPVSISSKTLSQGERKLRLTKQAYDRLQETAQRPFTEIHRNPTIIKKDAYRREKMKRKMQKDSRRRNRGK